MRVSGRRKEGEGAVGARYESARECRSAALHCSLRILCPSSYARPSFAADVARLEDGVKQ